MRLYTLAISITRMSCDQKYRLLKILLNIRVSHMGAELAADLLRGLLMIEIKLVAIG